ncbi:TAXI family TRAP transporter solute-binding subunit [Ramlibacter albus]|uniref:TAXI family TRAP transporter solute-binding subunit n=1 Tax=Ramlibacter albus TaxID=2079448 RepID=A0A923MFE8_9BURK|nr:TAXI family TRAP transporter solute-binding subunit [Ramlibacter albus]MBC5768269.1 TAXI family TRAP transporter solute-binding subunit [Ramlibacter albus]
MAFSHWVAAFAATLALSAHAQQTFRIGTGDAAGTYHPLGGMIANAVSQPGRIKAAAQTSTGSLANVSAVASGAVEAGFAQSDVAAWAYNGTGAFEGKPKVSDLRMIANLYPESIHIVVKRGSPIRSVTDLKGKRVALDEAGSGTLINARMVLAAYGLNVNDIKAEYIGPRAAGDKLKAGNLDAFFFVGGAPAGVIDDLATSGPGIDLVPISGAPADQLRGKSAWFTADTILGGMYKDVPTVETLAVGAQLVTSAKVDAETVYQVTKALYGAAAQKALQSSHAKGKYMTPENAVKGVGIPFHPGAERFYKEAGVLRK